MFHSPTLPEILRLDPVRDHRRIMFLSLCYDFAIDAGIVGFLALLRSFSVPEIAVILERTGHFHSQGAARSARLIDTMSKLIVVGYDTPAGRRAIERMNRVHAAYPSTPEDYVYVLSQFVLEMVRWAGLYGGRRLTPVEVEAYLQFWREVGVRMEIPGIPATYEALVAFAADYEKRRCCFSPANRSLFLALEAVWLGWFPCRCGRWRDR